MPLIKSIRSKVPKWGKNCWFADTATIVGEVQIGDRCSFWFNTVVRGDVNDILIGDEVNIQDGAILHCTYEKANLEIGNRVSIGHGAIVHGGHIEDDVLIGMGAIVMDNARVPSEVIVGAGTIVPEGKVLERGYIYVGQPARILRPLDEEMLDILKSTSANYIHYASWYK